MKISVENLNMIYKAGKKAGKKALKDVSLQIESPSLIGLLGPNGAGKSTLMKLLVAELIPTSGEILIDGVPLLKNEKKLKASLGYLPQSFGLYDELTVWQFLDYMAALKGIKNSKKVIKEVIEKTNLTEKRKARISAACRHCPGPYG
ncbi:ABC transporter family protein [Clostridium botulinum]|nr:ABC transporter family protein [Clostridium botulinum CDC_297]APQ99004.1 ABC transporter family protein [Clostridium botulinum]